VGSLKKKVWMEKKKVWIGILFKIFRFLVEEEEGLVVVSSKS